MTQGEGGPRIGAERRGTVIIHGLQSRGCAVAAGAQGREERRAFAGIVDGGKHGAAHGIMDTARTAGEARGRRSAPS
jgi:hypothetical protein